MKVVDRTAIREIAECMQCKCSKKIDATPQKVSSRSLGAHVLLPLICTLLICGTTGHIPESTLIGGEGSVIPHVDQDAARRDKSVDIKIRGRVSEEGKEKTEKQTRHINTPLGSIFVGLVFDLFDLNFHSILGQSNMLALHLLACVLAHSLHDTVRDEQDGGKDTNENEKEDEWDETAGAHDGSVRSVVGMLSSLDQSRSESEDLERCGVKVGKEAEK